MLKLGSLNRRLKRAVRRRLGLSIVPIRIKTSVRDSGLFDAQWYIEKYSDVRAAKIDPLDHYLTEGWAEGRNPSSLFDTNWYLATYPDVRAAGANPLLHYIRHGCLEARDVGPGFRPSLATHPNLLRGAHHLAVATKYMAGIAQARDRSIITVPRQQRVLIVAELSIPQCRKYRVDQKQSLLRLIGYESTVINWHDVSTSSSLLLTHSFAIFYRVPALDPVLAFIKLAKSHDITTFWEVDDLVFDPNSYIHNSNLDTLSRDLQHSVLSGVPLYRAAMLACDYGIASTAPLREEMIKAGVRRVDVVENALDQATLFAAKEAIALKDRVDGLIIIGYGSGTKTHDVDFLEATAALVYCLQTYPRLRLRIIGELTLADELTPFLDRIERLPTVAYEAYLRLIANCDISIAPLEGSVFNDCKSNIKYIEASVVGVPSVCSATAAFKDVIVDGEDGFLADTDHAWKNALSALIESAPLRASLAEAARHTVLSRYSPKNVAFAQLGAILPPVDVVKVSAPRATMRVLSVNVFFEPRSFGGATIVAEQMAHILHGRDDTEVAIFTTAPPGVNEAYHLMQYDIGSMPVFAVVMPEHQNAVEEFEDLRMAARFREVLRFVKPDVVHIHCVQNIGSEVLELCEEEGIPAVVTAHDAWWICRRQFMVTGEDVYCHQRKIDLNVCASCVPDAGLTTYRQYRLHRALNRATLILTPSEFFKGLYLDNKFTSEKVRVNKNGVKDPGDIKRTESSRLRFGFVGGNSPIKGANVIKVAFADLQRSNYELVLVDNAMSLGYNSLYAKDWRLSGDVAVLPSYTQENMDDFFSRIDVLLFPTQWKESFGLTVREALIRDIWVIATDAGGVVEDIVDGVNGTIIPLSGDPEALRAAIEAALDRAAELKRHVNPLRDSITTYKDQAEQLRAFLAEAIRTRKDGGHHRKSEHGPLSA